MKWNEDMFQYYFPIKEQFKFSDYFLWSIYGLFLLLMVYILFLFVFIKNPFYTGYFVFILFFYIIVNFTLIIFYIGYQYHEIKENEPIFFRSLPEKKSKIRDSIKKFIENSYELNPFIYPYDENYTYIYFDTSFNEIMLKSKVTQYYSQYELDIEKILTKYPYIPIGIVKNDSLYSLLNKPFLNLEPQ